MKERLFSTPAIAASVFFLVSSALPISAQNPAVPGASQNGVVLAKLSEPIYPPLARTTRIAGDVVLILGVRKDGSIESAVVDSGHPLLKQAALDSAQRSQFECRECSDSGTSYRLVYTFELEMTECCRAPAIKTNSTNDGTDQVTPRVIQSQGHVTIIDKPTCFCDVSGDIIIKVRSLKCLYLW
jgi:TonB family protein